MPIRLQRKRTAGFTLPANTVCVTRPGIYGNPFVVGTWQSHPLLSVKVLVRDNHHAKVLFDNWLTVCKEGRKLKVRIREELKGKNLACWCPVGDSCHADIILEIANDRYSE